MTSEPFDRAVEALRGGGVVAFTGAGISAESGIPTFRDPGGVWDRFDPEEFGTWDGLARLAVTRPDALAGFLAELRRAIGGARPGRAHEALARLEGAGLLEAVITQNVDGLHQDAGSRRVLELHGSFLRSVCLACGHRQAVERPELLADLDRAIVGLRTAFIPSLASLLPRCRRCGSPARPDFVAFGETVHELAEAERLAGESRALLVIGTSGEVYPAAEIPARARAAGRQVLEIAGGPSAIEADVRLEGRAGDLVPKLTGAALGR